VTKSTINTVVYSPSSVAYAKGSFSSCGHVLYQLIIRKNLGTYGIIVVTPVTLIECIPEAVGIGIAWHDVDVFEVTNRLDKICFSWRWSPAGVQLCFQPVALLSTTKQPDLASGVALSCLLERVDGNGVNTPAGQYRGGLSHCQGALGGPAEVFKREGWR
jgi:hypothetical protein